MFVNKRPGGFDKKPGYGNKTCKVMSQQVNERVALLVEVRNGDVTQGTTKT